jgi:hypothetical protein
MTQRADLCVSGLDPITFDAVVIGPENGDWTALPEPGKVEAPAARAVRRSPFLSSRRIFFFFFSFFFFFFFLCSVLSR